MTKCSVFPKCSQNRTDCFANESGNICIALSNTQFKDGRQCPFYKPKDQERKVIKLRKGMLIR